MKRSMYCRFARISRRHSVRQGSFKPSRNRSSPCKVHVIGRFSASLSGFASEISSVYGRSMMSGRGSVTSQSISFRISLA